MSQDMLAADPISAADGTSSNTCHHHHLISKNALSFPRRLQEKSPGQSASSHLIFTPAICHDCSRSAGYKSRPRRPGRCFAGPNSAMSETQKLTSQARRHHLWSRTKVDCVKLCNGAQTSSRQRTNKQATHATTATCRLHQRHHETVHDSEQ